MGQLPFMAIVLTVCDISIHCFSCCPFVKKVSTEIYLYCCIYFIHGIYMCACVYASHLTYIYYRRMHAYSIIRVSIVCNVKASFLKVLVAVKTAVLSLSRDKRESKLSRHGYVWQAGYLWA